MSTGVGMALLDPRVHMGISYYWKETKNTHNTTLNKRRKGIRQQLI